MESDESKFSELFGKTMQQSLSSHVFHYLSSILPLRRLVPNKTNNDFIQHCSDVRSIIRSYVKARRAQRARGEKGQMNGDVGDGLQILIDNESEWKDEEVVEYVRLPFSGSSIPDFC